MYLSKSDDYLQLQLFIEEKCCNFIAVQQKQARERFAFEKIAVFGCKLYKMAFWCTIFYTRGYFCRTNVVILLPTSNNDGQTTY